MRAHHRLALLFALPFAVHAAEPYKVGDIVEAWPDKDKTKLELCTVKAVLSEETYRLSCGYPNTDLTLGSYFIRRLHPKTEPEDKPTPAPTAEAK